MITEQFSKSLLRAATFANRAYAALDEMNSEEFWLRKDRESKALLEEIIPIAAFLKNYERPGVRVMAKYFGANHGFDAEMYVEDYRFKTNTTDTRYVLEVTSAVSEKEYLVRKELYLYGSSFGSGDIASVGSERKGNFKINSNPSPEDQNTSIEKTSEQVTKCLVAKSKKNYEKPCILLVQVDPHPPLSPREWAEIRENVYNFVDRESFVLTFIVDGWQNVIICL